MVSTRRYQQDVTYWANTGESLYGAQNAFASPVILKCRWENRQEQAVTGTGVAFTSKAVVFVPDPVFLGDFLALGDFTGFPDPTLLSDAYEIRGKSEIPDLRNVATERRAML